VIVIALVNGNANVGVIDAIVGLADTVNDAQRVGRPERYTRGTELLERVVARGIELLERVGAMLTKVIDL
jgi:hypothetical protein